MVDLPKENDNFLKYFTQIKQRIDLNINIQPPKVDGLTKLTFVPKNEPNDSIPEILILNLNAENIYIKSIKIFEKIKNGVLQDENSKKDGGGNYKKKDEKQKINTLEYTNSSPYYIKNYLDSLYANIEEMESFQNLNRIEWEIRQNGNLSIKIPKKNFIETITNLNYSKKDNNNSLDNKEGDNINKNIKINLTNSNINTNNNANINNTNNDKLNNNCEIKIIIDYEIIEKNIGIIFQEFYESRTDINYTLCYTPNFYFNTPNWVPCIYDLNLQLFWVLYLYIPDNYMAYTSCLLNKIVKNSKGQKLLINKCNEPTTARNIGFIVLHDKIFQRFFEPRNKNFFIVGNENKREKIEKNLINNKLLDTLYNYYDEFFDINETNIKSNLNTPTAIVFIPYLSINCPCQSYNKFIKLKDENYFSFIKFPSLYILPDKYIYNQLVPEISKFQLRILSKIFINNYIGGLIIEKTYADFWIINGLESWLSNLFLNKAFDSCYIKAKLYKWILKFKKICKAGKEILPLYTNNFSHPIDIQLNQIFDLKSKIIFHLLEAQVEKIFMQKALKNILNERHKKGYNISTESLIKIFKKNCGINLKHFMDLYVYKTGMFEIKLEYTYNQKTNSIDIKIHQEQIAKSYYEKHPFTTIKEIDINFLNKVGKNIQIIDYRTKPNRYFNIFFNLNILQTNGIEIMKDPHQIKLESDKENYLQNFPLISKIRKIPLKKREQDFIQDLIANTGINKIYQNDYIEQIFTQNSILWLRVDSELSSLHVNRIKQQHILYEYIKLFRDGDYIGQMESLSNIGKDQDSYSKTLQILRTLIEYPNIYYKVRQYAIKIYIKILLKLKNENEYQFLLDMLDDCYNELLKNKTSLNLETYYVMIEIIKYLGEYKETNFKQFYTVGFVRNSSMQNLIIKKFLAILFSNELNTIAGYDNCYIMAKILISSSKFNLQENSFILLQKILKNLRIEKLKRSVNEITIISTLSALINILIKNEFFYMQKDPKFHEILRNIFKEINYYINNDTEHYELRVFLEYFQIFLIFYKSKSYIEFSNNLIKFVLGPEYNNAIKMTNVSFQKNFSITCKIKALSYLFENNILYFDSLDDKKCFLGALKTILYSPICYLRGDCRNIMQELYKKFFEQKITEIGAGNNNFNNNNFLHLLNKNWLNYSSKKYVDDDWLYTFINEERASIDSDAEDNMTQEDLSSVSHIQNHMNEITFNQIKKYRQKYKDDEYALMHSEINIDKSFNEICLEIVEILLHHPLAEPFSYELNMETLGDLYEQYMETIQTPIDLDTIKNKILNNEYEDFQSFNRDICLMFSNCKQFNERGSYLYNTSIHLDDYYKLIIFPFKKKKLINKNYKVKEMDYSNNNTNKITIEGINKSEQKNHNNNIIINFDDEKSNNKNIQINNKKFIIPTNISGELGDMDEIQNNIGESMNSENNNYELLGKKRDKSKNHKDKNTKKMKITQ